MLELKDENFREVIGEKELVMIDFKATWCGPCKMLMPVIEKLSEEYEGKVDISVVDVEQNTALAAEYGIRNIPCLVFIKNGVEVERHVGATTKSKIAEKLDNLIGLE